MRSELLTKQHQEVKEICEKLGKEVLDPNREIIDREGLYPRENMKEMSKYGINAITVPCEYSGMGLDYTAFAIATETLAQYCASTAMVYVMHLSAVETINLVGTPEQKQEFLLPLREGKIGSLAFSEPATGGHFWYCVSQAQRNGQDYIVSAQKSFVTSAGHTDWYIVQTRTPDSEKPEDMSYFLIYNHQPGVSAAGKWDAMGLRGNSSGPMMFDKVNVEAKYLLGREGDARYWNDNAIDPMFLLGSSACWLGIAEGALKRAIYQVNNTIHKDFNKRTSDYQVIRHYLSKMQINTTATRTFLYSTAKKLDVLKSEGKPLGELLFDLWQLKVFASQNVIDVTNLAVQVTGGRGYKRGPIEQAYRDGRAGALMGPTNEMCSEWVAKTILGMPLGYWYEDHDV